MNSHNLPLIKTNRYFSPLKKRVRYFSPKNIIKKYYGRKILFVDKKTQFTAAMNRSKYLLRFEIDEKAIPGSSLKYLANLVIFNTSIVLKYCWGGFCCHRHVYYPNIHPLQLKKALRSCKNPKPRSPQFKHIQHLFHLKSLTLHVTNGSSMSKASKIIRKLRLLQSFQLKYLSDYNESDQNVPIKVRVKPTFFDSNDETGWRFFYKISKLPRLQTLHIQTSLRTLQGQSSVVQQDFADFYSRSHPFKIDTEVYTNSSLDIKELTAKNMSSLLETADSLSVHLGVSRPAKKNPYMCQDPQEKMKILKQGERPVKFFVYYKKRIQVNIGCLLTKCENLESLYLKVSGQEVLWDQDYGDLSRKLQTAVLDLDSLGLKYEIMGATEHPRFDNEEKIYEIVDGRKVKFHSGLLELLKQLKRRAVGLETLTLFMCLANFKKSWLQPKSFKELYEKMVEEKAREFFEELESFEKLHKIDICKKAGDLDEYLNRTLAAKSLKKVNVRSFCDNI